jgi:hypothetical protein
MPTDKYLSKFRFTSPVVLNCFTLQLRRYNYAKLWWLPTSWHNDVRAQKTWILMNIAVKAWNVTSKQYRLLQVLVAALLLVSCTTFVKRYPDPLECNKYYLRIDDTFYKLTCPGKLLFDQNIEQCTLNTECKLEIPLLPYTNCNQNKPGYYCESLKRFTYCTEDNKKIIDHALCPSSLVCISFPYTKPCYFNPYRT